MALTKITTSLVAVNSLTSANIAVPASDISRVRALISELLSVPLKIISLSFTLALRTASEDTL